MGLEYLTSVPDFEINFGRFKTKREQKGKRQHMEREYLQAIGFYLDHAPRYNVLGIEVSAIAHPKGLALPIKAISDLVVKSRKQKGALDIVDHKFVDSFSAAGAQKTLFVIQAMFNYFTVQEQYKKPVRRFILHECKKRKNADESKQMRRYVIDYTEHAEEFKLFQRLINDATKEIARRRIYLPNPSDMFEGEDSVAVYKMGLVDSD